MDSRTLSPRFLARPTPRRTASSGGAALARFLVGAMSHPARFEGRRSTRRDRPQKADSEIFRLTTP
jgi:hypothetical protein